MVLSFASYFRFKAPILLSYEAHALASYSLFTEDWCCGGKNGVAYDILAVSVTLCLQLTIKVESFVSQNREGTM